MPMTYVIVEHWFYKNDVFELCQIKIQVVDFYKMIAVVIKVKHANTHRDKEGYH